VYGEMNAERLMSRKCAKDLRGAGEGDHAYSGINRKNPAANGRQKEGL